MIFAILAFLTAFLIAFGRQSAAIGKIKRSLWFFHNFETKRLIFTAIALILGITSLFAYENSYIIKSLFVFTILMLLFSFFFDMKFFFPEIYKVEQTKPKNLNPELSVIGVEIDGISIAYPLEEVVIPRHLINDTVNNTPILVSYCALCRSALIFKAEIEERKLYFKVSGVWRRNMIVFDTETYSLWQQATGECIYGALKGKQLELLSGENTSLGGWKKKHPDTLFASKCIEARKGLMSREMMNKRVKFITSKVTMPGFSDLSELPNKAIVFGVKYNGINKAYPKNEIEGFSSIIDSFGNKQLRLEYNERNEYLTAYLTETGEEIIVEKHWWLGWKEFHPNTIVWRKDEYPKPG